MSEQSKRIRLAIQLSRRQREVLRLTAEGETTVGIGIALGLAPKTVEYHRKILMDRTNLHSYQELTKLALRLGLSTINV